MKYGNLFMVDDLLRKDPVLVSDAVAVAGHAEGGHAVQEASRQPAKSTVTKTSVRLKVLHLLDIKTQLKFIDFNILSSRCRQFLILSQSMQWYYRIPSF